MVLKYKFTLHSGPPGVDAHVPRLSFSAALTRPQANPGTIVFDKVFVNEAKAYNAKTGTNVIHLILMYFLCKLRWLRLCVIITLSTLSTMYFDRYFYRTSEWTILLQCSLDRSQKR